MSDAAEDDEAVASNRRPNLCAAATPIGSTFSNTDAETRRKGRASLGAVSVAGDAAISLGCCGAVLSLPVHSCWGVLGASRLSVEAFRLESAVNSPVGSSRTGTPERDTGPVVCDHPTAIWTFSGGLRRHLWAFPKVNHSFATKENISFHSLRPHTLLCQSIRGSGAHLASPEWEMNR